MTNKTTSALTLAAASVASTVFAQGAGEELLVVQTPVPSLTSIRLETIRSRDEALLRDLAAALMARYSDLLEGTEAVFTRVDTFGTVFYRLDFLDVPDERVARRICEVLEMEQCLVASPGASQLVTGEAFVIAPDGLIDMRASSQVLGQPRSNSVEFSPLPTQSEPMPAWDQAPVLKDTLGALPNDRPSVDAALGEPTGVNFLFPPQPATQEAAVQEGWDRDLDSLDLALEQARATPSVTPQLDLVLEEPTQRARPTLAPTTPPAVSVSVRGEGETMVPFVQEVRPAQEVASLIAEVETPRLVPLLRPRARPDSMRPSEPTVVLPLGWVEETGDRLAHLPLDRPHAPQRVPGVVEEPVEVAQGVEEVVSGPRPMLRPAPPAPEQVVAEADSTPSKPLPVWKAGPRQPTPSAPAREVVVKEPQKAPHAALQTAAIVPSPIAAVAQTQGALGHQEGRRVEQAFVLDSIQPTSGLAIASVSPPAAGVASAHPARSSARVDGGNDPRMVAKAWYAGYGDRLVPQLRPSAKERVQEAPFAVAAALVQRSEYAKRGVADPLTLEHQVGQRVVAVQGVVAPTALLANVAPHEARSRLVAGVEQARTRAENVRESGKGVRVVADAAKPTRSKKAPSVASGRMNGVVVQKGAQPVQTTAAARVGGGKFAPRLVADLRVPKRAAKVPSAVMAPAKAVRPARPVVALHDADGFDDRLVGAPSHKVERAMTAHGVAPVLGEERVERVVAQANVPPKAAPAARAVIANGGGVAAPVQGARTAVEGPAALAVRAVAGDRLAQIVAPSMDPVTVDVEAHQVVDGATQAVGVASQDEAVIRQAKGGVALAGVETRAVAPRLEHANEAVVAGGVVLPPSSVEKVADASQARVLLEARVASRLAQGVVETAVAAQAPASLARLVLTADMAIVRVAAEGSPSSVTGDRLRGVVASDEPQVVTTLARVRPMETGDEAVIVAGLEQRPVDQPQYVDVLGEQVLLLTPDMGVVQPQSAASVRVASSSDATLAKHAQEAVRVAAQDLDVAVKKTPLIATKILKDSGAVRSISDSNTTLTVAARPFVRLRIDHTDSENMLLETAILAAMTPYTDSSQWVRPVPVASVHQVPLHPRDAARVVAASTPALRPVTNTRGGLVAGDRVMPSDDRTALAGTDVGAVPDREVSVRLIAASEPEAPVRAQSLEGAARGLRARVRADAVPGVDGDRPIDAFLAVWDQPMPLATSEMALATAEPHRWGPTQAVLREAAPEPTPAVWASAVPPAAAFQALGKTLDEVQTLDGFIEAFTAEDAIFAPPEVPTFDGLRGDSQEARAVLESAVVQQEGAALEDGLLRMALPKDRPAPATLTAQDELPATIRASVGAEGIVMETAERRVLAPRQPVPASRFAVVFTDTYAVPFDLSGTGRPPLQRTPLLRPDVVSQEEAVAALASTPTATLISGGSDMSRFFPAPGAVVETPADDPALSMVNRLRGGLDDTLGALEVGMFENEAASVPVFNPAPEELAPSRPALNLPPLDTTTVRPLAAAPLMPEVPVAAVEEAPLPAPEPVVAEQEPVYGPQLPKGTPAPELGPQAPNPVPFAEPSPSWPAAGTGSILDRDTRRVAPATANESLMIRLSYAQSHDEVTVQVRDLMRNFPQSMLEKGRFYGAAAPASPGLFIVGIQAHNAIDRDDLVAYMTNNGIPFVLPGQSAAPLLSDQ